ncbi:MAG: hypothetical protein A2X37_06780 [Elusimicrobia bacterium GWA2_66_18]|nr:MAG: hypothetical protein A2X37_06780 [Elusimicrobia bacterium GWA2_66_18]
MAHGGAGGDDAADGLARLDLRAQAPHFAHEIAVLDGLAQGQDQDLGLHWLGEVVEGARLHRGHRGVDGAVSGDDDDPRLGLARLHGGDHPQPVARAQA